MSLELVLDSQDVCERVGKRVTSCQEWPGAFQVFKAKKKKKTTTVKWKKKNISLSRTLTKLLSITTKDKNTVFARNGRGNTTKLAHIWIHLENHSNWHVCSPFEIACLHAHRHTCPWMCSRHELQQHFGRARRFYFSAASRVLKNWTWFQ